MEHELNLHPVDSEPTASGHATGTRDPAVLRAVAVMTNTLGHARGGRWVLPCARAEDDRMRDIEIDLTAPSGRRCRPPAPPSCSVSRPPCRPGNARGAQVLSPAFTGVVEGTRHRLTARRVARRGRGRPWEGSSRPRLR
ncbi:hypothetical protein GCM10009550_58120 [Actinocorallia libanotica]|uniref:Uncharacterized protein n=1 Tax=Actinocorallia libanotica TaxID=46162 RepID=A0ABN1RSZ4_9ACTN